MGKLIEINMNKYVYLELNEKGWEYWCEKENKNAHTKYIRSVKELKNSNLLDNGLCSLQIHRFLDIFGGASYEGLMKIRMIFNEEDLKPYTTS